MAKFKFEIEAGFLIRNDVRTDLERSKDSLEYLYPGGSVSIREEKTFWESTFYVQGVNFPNTDKFIAEIENWTNKIKIAVNEI